MILVQSRVKQIQERTETFFFLGGWRVQTFTSEAKHILTYDTR